MVLLVSSAAACDPPTTVTISPLDLVIGSGDGQFGVVGNQLALPLRVVVQSAITQQPRRGVNVQWDVTQGGATIVGTAMTVTDSTGSTEVRVRLGAGPGAVGVRARIADQPSAYAEFGLFAVTQPTVASIAPGSTITGDTVVLTGTSFSPVPEQNVVLFSGIRGRVVTASPTALGVIVPRCLPVGDIRVHMQLGTVASTDTVTLAVTGGTVVESLPVGGVIDVADDGGFECHALPGTGGATYLVVVYSASTVGAARHPYRLTALTTPGPLATPVGAAAALPHGQATRPADPQAVWDQHLRSLEGDLIRARVREAAPVPPAATAPAGGPAAVPAVGERRTFSVLNAQGSFDQVGAIAEWVGTRAAIFVDTLAPPGGFNLGELATFAARFDQVIHPQVTSNFGSASDLDGNERVVVLFTPAVNRLTPPAAAGFIGGFFYGVDLLPSTPGSNAGEVFYSLVPDPTGIHGNPRSKSLVAGVVPAILAHEFQHMVHFNERILVRGAATQEALWLSEGLAQMAEEVVARAYQWLGDSASDSIFRSGTRARARLYLADPDTVSLIVTTGQGSLPERGAGFLHVLYLDDRFGAGILGRLTRTKNTGVGNVEAESGVLWPALVADAWSAAYLDGLPAGTAPNAYPTVDLRGFLAPFPLAPTTITAAGLQATGALWSSSAAYYRVNTVGAPVALRLGGERGGPSPAQSVLRLRIVRLS